MRKSSLIILFVLCFTFPALAEIKPFFTPSLDCERTIIELMDEAIESIDAAVYSISNKEITAAIKRAHDRGVKMRILTDKLQATGKYATARDLHAHGVNIRIHSKHKIEHNKFLVVDGQKLVTGSYNWTDSASNKNSENCLLVTRNKKVIAEYVERFEYLWEVNSKEKSDEWFLK